MAHCISNTFQTASRLGRIQITTNEPIHSVSYLKALFDKWAFPDAMRTKPSPRPPPQYEHFILSCKITAKTLIKSIKPWECMEERSIPPFSISQRVFQSNSHRYCFERARWKLFKGNGVEFSAIIVIQMRFVCCSFLIRRRRCRSCLGCSLVGANERE